LFIINNKNNNNKQRKNMNNFKKIGMTALAASLVSTSVFAGEMAVTGSAGINWENYSADKTAGSKAAGTKAFSMGNQLTFTGSGELDNGLTVGLSFVLDQNDDSTAAGAAYAGGPFDSHSVSVSSDAFGTLKFHGEGGDSAQNAAGDTAAGNIWDNFDTKNGTKLKESRAGDNIMHYTLPSMVDGLTVAASYTPSTGRDEADSAYALTYAGIEGLSVSYASGSNDGQLAAVEGAAAQPEKNADVNTIKASYAYGPVTLAYSDHEYDSSTATEDQDAKSFKVSYTVSDAVSITYAEEEIDSGTAADQDAKYSKLSTSYTTGGMTVSANMQEMENGDYSTAASADEDYVGLSVSFAF
jgi:outer membrane protein OmpU